MHLSKSACHQTLDCPLHVLQNVLCAYQTSAVPPGAGGGAAAYSEGGVATGRALKGQQKEGEGRAAEPFRAGQGAPAAVLIEQGFGVACRLRAGCKQVACGISRGDCNHEAHSSSNNWTAGPPLLGAAHSRCGLGAQRVVQGTSLPPFTSRDGAVVEWPARLPALLHEQGLGQGHKCVLCRMACIARTAQVD